MKSSEELMLLLELNGFDTRKFKLKKQLEYEKTGNLELYKHKKYADLIVCHYTFNEDADFYHRNPLTYQVNWNQEVRSMDQFHITHPDLDNEITLKEFLNLKDFNQVNRESILYDVLDNWVEEYRESSITQMENLREMVKLLPKKSKKYKKPSKITFLTSVILALLIMLLYKAPDSLKPSFLIGMLSFWETIIDDYVQLLYDVPWYSFLGNVAIFLMIGYAVLNNFISRYIRDVRSEKNKRAEQTFDKWEQDMKDSRLKQAGILEDYVDIVVKNPDKSELELKQLIGPSILLDKFKDYVQMIEKRYDWMTKYYKTMFRLLRLEYVLAFVVFILFFAVGFALIRGWI
ncbi:hypothetical protein KQ51_00452 [Candidatus Izimaplasma bacterium HR1]|jgi:hypothetical protein|uniref:hypothetical protein n=1 Tax=Candidatus Izimoplasma sp. HR1 TaxID=1541959 RepID=UPI0004F663B1|nr:hypothetical protein KQ51_00452 [Candidatus Izimaplasma bacterium HR1]